MSAGCGVQLSAPLLPNRQQQFFILLISYYLENVSSILFNFLLAKPIGCKYMRNYSVSQIFFQIERKSARLADRQVGFVGRSVVIKLLLT